MSVSRSDAVAQTPTLDHLFLGRIEPMKGATVELRGQVLRDVVYFPGLGGDFR